jgi:2-methylaconitate cis-trans-isomerase PrpF
MMHTPLFPLVPQQLRFVRQLSPSRLHGSAETLGAVAVSTSTLKIAWINNALEKRLT